MHPTLFQNALRISGPILQALVAAMIIHRRLLRRFPVFAGYTIFHVLLVVLFAASQLSYRAYFDLYWGAEFLDMVLTFMVIQELFSHAFLPYEAVRELGQILFRLSAVAMIALSVIIARSGGGPSTSHLVTRFVTLERSVHVLEIGVLFMLFLVCRLFGIVWHRFAFGIAVGIGLALSGEAVAAALRVSMGSKGNHLYAWLAPASYTIATVVWAYYATFGDPVAEISSSSLPPTQLAEWDRALEHFLTK